MALTAKATDGNSHAVKLYTDISAEWTSGDRTLNANWSTTTTSSILTHQAQLETQTVYGEFNDQIQRMSSRWSDIDSVLITHRLQRDLSTTPSPVAPR